MKFPFTSQEAFDIAYSKVIEQGRSCTNSAGECVYAGPNGLRCAASFVFHESNPDFDQSSFDFDDEGVTAAEAIEKLGYDKKKNIMLLMNDIQSAHDSCAQAEEDGPRFVLDYKIRMAKKIMTIWTS